MRQRAEVANHEIIEMEHENVIAAELLAALVICERPYPRNEDALDFILPGAGYHHRVTLHRCYRVVMWVVVADGYDVGPLPWIAQAEALVVGVGNYGRVLALQAEARVA